MSSTLMSHERATRVPSAGKIDMKLEVSRMDMPTLTDLLREAEQYHSQYEPKAPKHHWSGRRVPGGRKMNA